MKKPLGIILIFIFLWACTPAMDKPKNNYIHGIAAKGAFFPDGSVIELRGSPTLTGNDIVVGQNPDGSDYIVPEETPSIVVSATVVGNAGEYSIDVTGLSAPYLIRAQDSVSGKWYYSYAGIGADTANINPYTDWMVQNFYYGVYNININDCFATGIFTVWGYGDDAGNDIQFTKSSYGLNKTKVMWYGMPMPMPDNTMIQRVMGQLQYIINVRYSVDIGDVLTRNWVLGEDYDSILDSTTIDSAWISRNLANMCFADDMMDHGIAYYNVSAGTIHVELWSVYAYCKIMEQNGNGLLQVYDNNPVNGLYHYVYDSSYSTHAIDEAIRISDKEFSTPEPGCVFSIVTYDK